MPNILERLVPSFLRRRRERDLESGRDSRPIPGEAVAQGGDRRSQGPRPAAETLDRNLAEKVLGGWLQNQHQTLVPLALRLDRLPPPQADLLMRFTAVACLAGSSEGAERRQGVLRWLQSIKADARAVATFEAALSSPEPLSRLIDSIRADGTEAYAYAAAVAAGGRRGGAESLFSDYVGARLALPADAIRSINRRHRR